MADELYNELLAKGFLPELKFRNDNHTKLLYVKNQSVDSTRISKLGNLNVPVFQLDEQNETLKAVIGGTRVHLAPSDEIIIDSWPCVGVSTSTARFFDYWGDGQVKNFEVTIDDGSTKSRFTISGDNSLDVLMLNNPLLESYLLSEGLIVNSIPDDYIFSMTNLNNAKAYQVEIKQTNGEIDVWLIVGELNTSTHILNPNTIRFCLSGNSDISCMGAIDHIRLTLSSIWEWGTTLTVKVNDEQRLWAYGEESPNFTNWFNLNFGSVVRVTSGSDYRFDNQTTNNVRISITTNALEFVEPVQPSPPYNITYGMDGRTLHFCLAPAYVISCADATDFIHYQINQTNLEDIVVDGVSYGNDLTVFNTDPTLSAIFDADYDTYGILYNISQDPHRVRFVGYNLDFSQTEGSDNTTIMVFEDGNVGVCLGPQQPTGLQPLTFSLQANPILKPYWDRAEMFNGQYFISGQADQYNYNPAMRRSVDGVNWIDVVLPDTVPIYNLVVGPDKILAVGPRGGGYWSSDGINWSKCTFNISRDIYDGIYVNGQYVLVGEYASLFTSTDGISFTALLDGTNLSTHPVFGGGVASYSSISYGNGKYIISGRYGTTNYPQNKNAFFASSNLTSWTVWSDTTTYPNGNLNEPSHQDMIFDGTQFVSIALGTVGSSDVPVFYGVTYTSADGVTWTRTQSLTDYPSRIVWADDAYITSDYTNGIKTSTDLTNWTTIYTRTQLNGRSMGGLVYKNNTLLAAGYQNQIILGTRG